MSRPSALLRFFAAALIRNLVPYGLASVAAAAVVVSCMFGLQVSSGGSVAPGSFAAALGYGSVITFVLAFPASTVFIAIGEWRRLGSLYHVVAGSLSGILSYGIIIMPQQAVADVVTLGLVAIGGAVGGGVFVAVRKLLVSILGDLEQPLFGGDGDNP